jgi:hypothetical protein
MNEFGLNDSSCFVWRSTDDCELSGMMDERSRTEIELHTAGATVRHAGPYSELEVPENRELPDEHFIRKWIKPFYFPMSVFHFANLKLRAFRSDI